MTDSSTHIAEPPLARLLFSDRRLAPGWLLLRLAVGAVWLSASMQKIFDRDGEWIGAHSGQALTRFAEEAMMKVLGEHFVVSDFYAGFLSKVVIPHATFFSWLLCLGELVVGIALLLGLFTGVAAFVGGFLNFSFLLAGAASVNPLLFAAATWLVLGWRVAGYIGLDRFVLPSSTTPSEAPNKCHGTDQ